MSLRSFPGLYALRFPHLSPDLEAGGGETLTDEIGELKEEPGDREPEAGEAPPAEPAAGEDTQTAGDETATDTEGAGGDDTVSGGEGEDTVTGTAGEEGEEEPPAGRKTDWRDKQIIKARQAAKEATERADAIERENAALKALSTAAPDEQAKAAQDKIREEAKVEARKELDRDNYFANLNKGIDAMVGAGEKAFAKTWAQRAKQAAEAVGEEMAARPEFLETITSLDNAAAVYHDLAGDPDRMEELLAMPAHKMAMEITKLSMKLSTAPKAPALSRVPPPIAPLDKPPVQGRTLEELADDPSPAAQAEFNRRMDAEDEKRAAAARRR